MVGDKGHSDGDDRGARAREIAAEASRLDTAAARSFIAEACGDDLTLLAEVGRLLDEHSAETSGAEAAQLAESRHSFSHHRRVAAVERIGPYRIVREVGSGGFGVVYLAVHEGERFRKHVAIKVVKRGFDSDEIVRRFEMERQVLAAMNHPNIARLYEGGTTDDGRPYFAMEYIEGLPIDEYCDRNRLGVDERLALFRQVCAGVQYAHQNLVVHRDLKPRNIIVTGEGVPKLLDFGIAKLLNPELSLIAHDPTSPELRIMTPEYASPEQVRGDSVTTASDVYSLGVLLYELLTGHRPYHIDRRIRAEIERVVCEVEPTLASDAIQRTDTIETADDRGGTTTKTITPEEVSRTRGAKPDTLRRRLSGDLDNIILMSMRKEPHRRYQSVERLIDDIDRHQTGHPISARPNQLGYRLSKFLRRNKAGVAVAAAVLLAVVAIGWATVADARARAASAEGEQLAAEVRESELRVEMGLQREQAERHRAELGVELARQRAETVRLILKTLLDQVDVSIDRLAESAEARSLMLTQITTVLEVMRGEEFVDRTAIVAVLAAAHDRFGTLLAGMRGSGPVQLEDALEQHQRARELRAPLLADPAVQLETVWRAVANRVSIAGLYRRLGREVEALTELESAESEARDAVARDPDFTPGRRLRSTVVNDLASLLTARGDLDRASQLYAESLEVARRTAELAPGNYMVQRDVTVAELRVAGALVRSGRHDEAWSRYEAVIAARKRFRDERPDAGRERDLAVAHHAFGVALRDAGRLDDALPHLEAYRTTAAQLAAADPQDRRVASDVSQGDFELARLRLARGEGEAAVASATAAVVALAEWVADDSADITMTSLLAAARADLGRARIMTGDTPGGRDALDEAITALRSLTEMMPTNATLAKELADAIAAREALGD